MAKRTKPVFRINNLDDCNEEVERKRYARKFLTSLAISIAIPLIAFVLFNNVTLRFLCIAPATIPMFMFMKMNWMKLQANTSKVQSKLITSISHINSRIEKLNNDIQGLNPDDKQAVSTLIHSTCNELNRDMIIDTNGLLLIDAYGIKHTIKQYLALCLDIKKTTKNDCVQCFHGLSSVAYDHCSDINEQLELTLKKLKKRFGEVQESVKYIANINNQAATCRKC